MQWRKIISAVPAIVGETVPTPAASMVAEGKLAQVTVNEVDAAKVALGDKATLTFDALPGVTIAGTVAVVNGVGAVSQGVVSYTATISFDTQNPQIMPGMSMTADIITGTETGLIVPSSAVRIGLSIPRDL